MPIPDIYVTLSKKNPSILVNKKELIPALFPDTSALFESGYLHVYDLYDTEFWVLESDAIQNAKGIIAKPDFEDQSLVRETLLIELEREHDIWVEISPDSSIAVLGNGNSNVFGHEFHFYIRNSLPADLIQTIMKNHAGSVSAYARSISSEIKSEILRVATSIGTAIDFIADRRDEFVRPAIKAIHGRCREAFVVGAANEVLSIVENIWEKEQIREKNATSSSSYKLEDYKELFTAARRMNRKFIFFHGEPNSGKTYEARKILAQSQTGAYYAPLRLLALENRDSLLEMGVPCDLITGEERQLIPGARHVACTVEMADYNTPVDCVIIDEVQSLADPDRGWAWTAAIVGAPAKTVILVGSTTSMKRVKDLLEYTGEPLECVECLRKTGPLTVIPKPVPLSDIGSADAVVAFSRKDVLFFRDLVQRKSNKTAAVVYGSLSPVARRAEAQRFASGDAPVLVATDVIGMGLNLPIRRVLFTTMTKFDGVEMRGLNVMEIHQIGGRAGRYGFGDEVGEIGVVNGCDGTPAELQKLLDSTPIIADGPAWVAPTSLHLKEIREKTGIEKYSRCLAYFVKNMRSRDGRLLPAPLLDMMALAETLENEIPSMPFELVCTYSMAPVDSNSKRQMSAFLHWARLHVSGEACPAPVLFAKEMSDLESEIRLVGLWLWLANRFPNSFIGLKDCQGKLVSLENRLIEMLKQTNLGGSTSQKTSKPMYPKGKTKNKGSGGHYGKSNSRGKR